MENSIFDSIITGIFCCIGMDLWQRVLFLTFNIPPTNWSTAGRWFIMMVSKKMIINQNLDNENPIKYELQIGWVFHYCVAIGYGLVYYFFSDSRYFRCFNFIWINFWTNISDCSLVFLSSCDWKRFYGK